MSAFRSYTAGYLHMRRQVCKKMQEKPGACHKPYIALLGKSLAGSQGPLCTFCTHDNKQHRHLTLTSVCFACPFTPFIVDENLLMHIHTYIHRLSSVRRYRVLLYSAPNIVKKDPGRARQNSLATAGINFTIPGAQNKGDLWRSNNCDCGRIVSELHAWCNRTTGKSLHPGNFGRWSSNIGYRPHFHISFPLSLPSLWTLFPMHKT